MDCLFVRSNLFSFQEKQLSGNTIKEIEDHLDSCEECSTIVSDFRSVTAFIERKKLDEPNPFMETRIIQKLESAQRKKEEKTIPVFQRVLRPISVSFLLLIAMFIGFSLVMQSHTKFSLEKNRQNDIQVMKSGLNIPDFIDEDNAFIDNY